MVEGQEGVGWEAWLALARACEEGGLDGLFRSDHYLSIVRGGRAGSLDAWATLAALAARTERIRIGTLLSHLAPRGLTKCRHRRPPSADESSSRRCRVVRGRARRDGLLPAAAPERMDALRRRSRETITRHWSEESPAWPKPVQGPHPPLIVGGTARPLTVAAAVRHADEYNTVFADPETCPRAPARRRRGGSGPPAASRSASRS